jgi:MFS family permease
VSPGEDKRANPGDDNQYHDRLPELGHDRLPEPGEPGVIAPDVLLGADPLEHRHAPKAARLWTRDFVFLVAANLSLFTGFYLLMPTMPLYAVERGGGDRAAGLVLGIFSISAVLIRPVAGWALDRFGRRLLIALSLVFFALNALAYQWAAAVLALLVLRFMHGLSWGVCTTGTGALAADLIPKPRLGEGMGYFGMAATVAMGIAPAAALAMAASWGFSPLFFVSAALATLALLLALAIDYPPLHRGVSRGILASLVAREALRPSLAVFFAGMTYGALLAFVALHAADQGVRNVGIFFTVYAVALTAIRPVAGRLADRRGFSTVLLPGFVLIGAALVILGAADRLALFVLAAVVYGMGFGAVLPALQALAVYGIAPERRGAASGTFYSAFDLGIAGGSTAGGVLAGLLGYASMFFVFAAAPLGALLFYLFAGVGHSSQELRDRGAPS